MLGMRKNRIIGVTFNYEVASYINSRMADAQIEGGSEGSGSGGYWIFSSHDHARRALDLIATSSRYRGGDLNISILAPEELKLRESTELNQILLERLPGGMYRELDYDSLEASIEQIIRA